MATDERRGLRRDASLTSDEVRWLAEARDEHGHLGLRIGVRGPGGEERVAEWPDLATLVTARDGSAARWTVAPNAAPLALARVQHEVGRALVHQARGGFALHASSVAWGDRAIAFVGESGAGKSTIAAYLTEHGASLCADDATCIDATGPTPRILPVATTMHALDANARAVVASHRHAGVIDARGVELEKTLATPRARSTDAPRLSGICVLRWLDDPDAAPSLTPLTGVAAVAQIVRHVLRFALDDAAKLRAELDTLSAFANAKIVCELARPRAMATQDRCGILLQAWAAG